MSIVKKGNFNEHFNDRWKLEKCQLRSRSFLLYFLTLEHTLKLELTVIFFFKFASSLGEFVEECTQVIFTLIEKSPTRVSQRDKSEAMII